MLVSLVRYLGIAVLAIAVIGFGAWVTSSDPKYNPASFEESALEQSLAPLDVGITLAQYTGSYGETVTLLVEQFDGKQVVGIDLADLGAARSSNPFTAVGSVAQDKLDAAFSGDYDRQTVAMDQLLPAGPTGDRHLGIGTNFPEHAEEALSDSVFNFPKFGTATPARTTVAAPEGGLMDYEVELCMRFDRPIASVADFDTARKGIFLCADFTDRIALLNLADLDNLDSGYGFSDAKSGVGFFPTGPLLVIPNDWKSFVADIRMTTEMNGEARQDARGHEMTLDFRDLAEKVLGDMDKQRFFYKGDYFKLAPNKRIEQDMTLMSGTSEGVIFTAPARHDYVEIGVSYLMQGGPFGDQGVMDVAIPMFIESERAGGHFLQPGDKVVYEASHLGDIVVEITP